MDDLNKNENTSSIYDQKDHLQVQIKEIFRDTLGIFYDSFAKTGWLRCRSIKATAKIYPKSIEQRQSMDDLNKNENMSSISDQKDHLQVQMEEIVRDTLGIIDDSFAKKVKKRGGSPPVDSFFGPIPCQEYGISMHSINPESQDLDIRGRLRQS
jgi:hypothetical protein